MFNIGESTPIKLGLVIAVMGFLLTTGGGAIWWASGIEANASEVKKETNDTKTILKEMARDISKGMKEMSTEIKATSSALTELMYKQNIILERQGVRLEGLKARVDMIETRQIRIIKENGH